MRCTAGQRKGLYELFESRSTPLADLLYHFDQRREWMNRRLEEGYHSEVHHLRDGKRVLGLAQSKLRHFLSDRWEVTPVGVMGNATDWIPKLLEVRILDDYL